MTTEREPLRRGPRHRAARRSSRALIAGSVALAIVPAAVIGRDHLRGLDLGAALASAATPVHGLGVVLALAVVAWVLLARVTAGSRPPLRSMVAGIVEAAYARPRPVPGADERLRRDARPQLGRRAAR